MLGVGFINGPLAGKVFSIVGQTSDVLNGTNSGNINQASCVVCLVLSGKEASPSTNIKFSSEDPIDSL